MLFKLPLVVPFRFLAAILHIVLSAVLMLNRDWNLVGCGAAIFENPSLHTSKDIQYVIALSFMIGLSSFEIISLIFGMSIYSNLQCFLSGIFHLSAFIALLYFMFYHYCVDSIWPIFATCSALPFFTEITTILRTCCCRKLPPW